MGAKWTEPQIMSKKLERHVSSLEQVKTREDLQQAVLKVRDIYDIDHVVYHSVDSHGAQYAALTYDSDWVDRYLEKKYAKIDPVVKECFRRFNPLDWRGLDWSSEPIRAFQREAMDAGVGNQGLSIPVRGLSGQFAMFTVTARRNEQSWAKFTAQYREDLLLVAHFVNQKAADLSHASDLRPKARLSPREHDALSLLASGYTRAQAAENLKISEHTLRVYIEAARAKLGAQNTTHAVAQAMSQGLIEF